MAVIRTPAPVRGGRSRRSLGSHVLRGTIAVVLALALAVGWTYRRQLISYLTHRQGGPSTEVPYAPFAPSDQPVLHVAVAGDVGYVGGRVDATGEAMARVAGYDTFDVLLLLGDQVYPTGDPARLQQTVFEPFGPLLAEGTKLLAILGNHDVMEDHGPGQVAALGMAGRWWAWSTADVLIVGLDSNEPDDPDQLQFLEQTLANADQTWKIVALHHPPYSAGYQGSSVHVRDVFTPLFEKYGVQLVLSGHDHDYQRSKMIDGVTYVVSGGGSNTRRTGSESFTAVSFSWHHFLELDVWPDHLIGRAIGQDLGVADEFTLVP